MVCPCGLEDLEIVAISTKHLVGGGRSYLDWWGSLGQSDLIGSTTELMEALGSHLHSAKGCGPIVEDEVGGWSEEYMTVSHC